MKAAGAQNQSGTISLARHQERSAERSWGVMCVKFKGFNRVKSAEFLMTGGRQTGWKLRHLSDDDFIDTLNGEHRVHQDVKTLMCKLYYHLMQKEEYWAYSSNKKILPFTKRGNIKRHLWLYWKNKSKESRKLNKYSKHTWTFYF